MAQHLTNEARMERAQTIGLQGLAFLLSEPRQLARLLDETGLDPAEIRSNAEAPEVLEAVLSVMVNDEALLLTFAANAGLTPEDVVQAHGDIASDGGRIMPIGST